MQVADTGLLYDDVMKVAFHPKGCHPSAYFFVIPVRDTGISFRNFIV
ncbi:hypothetical protein [Wolbachia endosymbiont of Aedes albopictus]|nr:hypothetical protein [Wolbachia endosymbiont of Aedes albopictus]UVW83781.1 hypothetical protein NHG98_05490 [Wolbachia endosymbiont of Aedes albopictus]